ncbi:pyridoxal phosphate-dependent aminotransferase [Haloimpatiens massiliensis]|uniref:pyridoxal phosphate-dependent aminotransferase n=1 Tax=Haloimpatiens massiliensis TaxID=1658110 RepID=UPI000C852593|nr:aminotransferase class I/II-fold pyridoxal phosphate-dependent enzyme [Haloimpatiens massiliensis]
MKKIIAENADKIEISGIRKFFNKVSQYEDVISLTLGQPDFKVPSKIKEAMIEAIYENKTTYTSNAGIKELREEISRYLKTLYIDYNPDEICVTVGGSQGLYAAFASVIDPGDKILIPSIAYPAYESCVKLLGGTVVNFDLDEKFNLDIENLKMIVKGEKPKVLVLSYPSNPTGAVLTEKLRNELYDLIKKNDILVITDEIYSSIYFDERYYSIAAFEDIKEKIIFVGGFSKMFSMTGLRIGYVCACKDILESIIKVHQYNVSCATSISQYGALEGLRSCMKDVEYMKCEFKRRRDYVYDRLLNMGLEVIKPDGAFYIFPSIKKFNISSEEFCDRLLKEQGVAIVPGSAFGSGGEGYIRISYCYSEEELEKALDGLEKFICNI